MRSAIVAAKKVGLDFTLACNMDGADKNAYRKDCEAYQIRSVNIGFNRNPLNPKNIIAFKQLNQLMREQHFDIVHCNTPIGGVLGRICAVQNHIPHIIYQAHGFHFWKGAPALNWLVYYPIEKLLAQYTDLLITINKEDYSRAQQFSYRGKGYSTFVHGIGISINNYNELPSLKESIRQSLQIPPNAKVFLSVGELNDNKNQITAIQAFMDANLKDSYYLLCGDGANRNKIEKIIEKNNNNKIKLLGYRSDIPQIIKECDYFIFPSYREGLSAALMEAMVGGLPCIVSRIRGNTDLLGEEYPYYFQPNDAKMLAQEINAIINDDRDWKRYVAEKVKPFSFECVVDELKNIYRSIK